MTEELLGKYCLLYNKDYTKIHLCKILYVKKLDDKTILVNYKVKNEYLQKTFNVHYLDNKVSVLKEKVMYKVINNEYYTMIGREYLTHVENIKKVFVRYLRRFYPEELL
jgi:hypothetical protein